MSRICLHGYVSGRVQGVWYRASTRDEARRLGVDGWAKNLADGRVEVLLCGDEAAVDKLSRWLHEGPPAARVDAVELQVCEESDVAGFEAR